MTDWSAEAEGAVVACDHTAWPERDEAPGVCAPCAAVLARRAERKGLERAATTADRWALSVSCDATTPCAHVRTGVAIAVAILREIELST